MASATSASLRRRDTLPPMPIPNLHVVFEREPRPPSRDTSFNLSTVCPWTPTHPASHCLDRADPSTGATGQKDSASVILPRHPHGCTTRPIYTEPREDQGRITRTSHHQPGSLLRSRGRPVPQTRSAEPKVLLQRQRPHLRALPLRGPPRPLLRPRRSRRLSAWPSAVLLRSPLVAPLAPVTQAFCMPPDRVEPSDEAATP